MAYFFGVVELQECVLHCLLNVLFNKRKRERIRTEKVGSAWIFLLSILYFGSKTLLSFSSLPHVLHETITSYILPFGSAANAGWYL